MFKVLIADDDYEDRELLKLEIRKALAHEGLRFDFHEAASVRQAVESLKGLDVDLLTLDIEFDRMNEGIEALPGIFEAHPTLNILIISGKLSKEEVAERLLRFTKDNVLKSKRWARHFDVLDKKDDKTEALRKAYSFSFKQKEVAGRVRELLLLAEAHLEGGDSEKSLEVYRQIQGIAPGERESKENITFFGEDSALHALDCLKRGEKAVAALLLGHHIDMRLKTFARKTLGRHPAGLEECLRELEKSGKIGEPEKALFREVLCIRDKAVHQPAAVAEEDFDSALLKLNLLEAARG